MSERGLAKHAPLLMQHSRRFRRNRLLQQYQLAARFTRNNSDHLQTLVMLARGALTNPIGLGRFLYKTRGKL